MSDANSRTVVLQDTLSLFGRGAATAVTFVQHQCDWLWAGDAKSVVLDVEVFDITAATTAPTLKVQTGLTPNGIWADSATYTAAATATLRLSRNPASVDVLPLSGWIRWSLVETANGGAWNACFRIHALIEDE